MKYIEAKEERKKESNKEQMNKQKKERKKDAQIEFSMSKFDTIQNILK
jgi:hypothetical protein